MAKPDYDYKDREIGDMSDRFFKIGQGRISGYLSVMLGAMSLMAVLAFLFPSYLTTKELREAYDVDLLKIILQVSIYATIGFGVLAFILKRRINGATAILLAVAAIALGGWTVPTGPVDAKVMSLGVDWLILDLLGSAIVFILIEKAIPKYPGQAILRPDWKLDLLYFALNHLAIGGLLFVSNSFAPTMFGWAVNANVQGFVTSLPIWGQFLLILFCADFVQYWVHRTFHEVPALWKIHAVHHSTEHMDWLAGSRNHIVQIMVDRTLVLVPLYLLGASTAALNIFVAFAAFQAVFIHANVGVHFGWFKYLLATPQFHHWHHSSEKPAIDTNYAVHLPIYDIVFRTFHMPRGQWPADYGTVSKIPYGWRKQFLYPFVATEAD